MGLVGQSLGSSAKVASMSYTTKKRGSVKIQATRVKCLFKHPPGGSAVEDGSPVPDGHFTFQVEHKLKRTPQLVYVEKVKALSSNRHGYAGIMFQTADVRADDRYAYLSIICPHAGYIQICWSNQRRYYNGARYGDMAMVNFCYYLIGAFPMTAPQGHYQLSGPNRYSFLARNTGPVPPEGEEIGWRMTAATFFPQVPAGSMLEASVVCVWFSNLEFDGDVPTVAPYAGPVMRV